MIVPQSYSIDRRLIEAVKEIAREESRSRSNVVNRAVSEYIKRHGYGYLLVGADE